MRNYFHSYILILALLLLAPSAVSAKPVVKAKLDSVTLLMGRTTTLQVTVDQRKGEKGAFPLFQQVPESGVIPVCGDSVELRLPSKVDTVDQGNSMQIVYQIPVQSFDSGYYRLPELLYVSGRDTIRSNRVALKVVPVPVSKDAQISDYANVSDPEDPSIFDSLPDWLYYYWWLVLIILLAVGALVYAALKYKKKGYLIPPKPQPSPYEVAISSLRQLKEKKLWENGFEKEYFTELTEILRVYLYKRFGINAMEMTSRQILASLSKNPELKDKRPYFRQILDMADFVKFAKVRPLPEDNIASYENAVRFVEETKPVPKPEDEEGAAPVAAKGKGKRRGKTLRKGGKK